MPIGPGYSWPDAIARAGAEIYYQVRAVILLPGRLLQGQIAPEVVRPVGPVGIYQVTEAVVDASQQLNTWFPLVQFIGAISVALGLTNLLPLPALDGGRILFVLIEAIRGKRVDPAREGLVHLIGMVMLLTFMVIITYQDIVNPILPR
jgi:regulator of sigma E protease